MPRQNLCDKAVTEEKHLTDRVPYRISSDFDTIVEIGEIQLTREANTGMQLIYMIGPQNAIFLLPLE